MNDTIITIFDFDNFLLGIHLCLDAPLEYVLQSAGDAYNCLARYQRLTKQQTLVVIVCDHEPRVVIVDDNDKKEVFSLKTLSFDRKPKKCDVIKVIHNNFQVSHYLPYLDVKADADYPKTMPEMLNETIKKIGSENVSVIKSVIWEKIEKEQQNEKI